MRDGFSHYSFGRRLLHPHWHSGVGRVGAAMTHSERQSISPRTLSDEAKAARRVTLWAMDHYRIANGDALYQEIYSELRRHRLRAEVGDDRERLGAAAIAFVKWALREGAWQGCDLDGGAMQDKAEELGLIVKEPYDPEKHGPNDIDAEPGDDWYVFAPAIRQAGKESKNG